MISRWAHRFRTDSSEADPVVVDDLRRRLGGDGRVVGHHQRRQSTVESTSVYIGRHYPPRPLSPGRHDTAVRATGYRRLPAPQPRRTLGHPPLTSARAGTGEPSDVQLSGRGPGAAGHQEPRARRRRAPARRHGGRRRPPCLRLRGGLRPRLGQDALVTAIASQGARRSTRSAPPATSTSGGWLRSAGCSWTTAVRHRPLPPALHGGARPAGGGHPCPGDRRPVTALHRAQPVEQGAPSGQSCSTGPPSGSTGPWSPCPRPPTTPSPAPCATRARVVVHGVDLARRGSMVDRRPRSGPRFGPSSGSARRPAGRDRGQPPVGEGLRRPARRGRACWPNEGLPSGSPPPARASLADELAARHRALGLGDRFRFLGHRHDALALLTAADIVVLPSHQEGLPVVLMEATERGRHHRGHRGRGRAPGDHRRRQRPGRPPGRPGAAGRRPRAARLGPRAPGPPRPPGHGRQHRGSTSPGPAARSRTSTSRIARRPAPDPGPSRRRRSRACATGQLGAEGLEPPQAELGVGLEVVALGPLVPRLDDHHLLAGRVEPRPARWPAARGARSAQGSTRWPPAPVGRGGACCPSSGRRWERGGRRVRAVARRASSA